MWCIENKINLVDKIKRAIYKIKAILKPILSFRYLVEEKMRNLQGK